MGHVKKLDAGHEPSVAGWCCDDDENDIKTKSHDDDDDDDDTAEVLNYDVDFVSCRDHAARILLTTNARAESPRQ